MLLLQRDAIHASALSRTILVYGTQVIDLTVSTPPVSVCPQALRISVCISGDEGTGATDQ